MVKASKKINSALALLLDEYLDEISHENWTIERPNAPVDPELAGYFDSGEIALENYAQLLEKFPELGEKINIENVVDADWQNAYKEFLKPWNCENLHWVPVWMRNTYELPSGEKAFYFDAGMAFGTGDHPTTRLCAVAMQEYIKAHKDYAEKSVVDAGCGSGILALSAALLGFKKIHAFDIDEDAITVSMENAAFNNIALDDITFEACGITRGLEGRKADLLLANIQADILSKYADDLVAGVAAGGTLVLSGILHYENADVRKLFEEKIGPRLISAKASFMGDWSSLVFEIR